MAFKLRSPLYKDDDKNKINFTTAKKLTSSPNVERASLGNALSQVNADDVPTPSADIDTEEKETSFDKLKSKVDAKEDVPVGADKNAFIKGRIELSTNPAQKARLKGKLAKRQEKQAAKHAKQTERAKAINVRNFGNEQGLSEMEIADREAASFDKEAALIEQEAKLNREIKPIEEPNNKGSFGLDTTFNKSPFKMKVNRAGRSKESGLLMTSPVLKTGKHSYKGAVAKMKMQNIAQTPLNQKISPKTISPGKDGTWGPDGPANQKGGKGKATGKVQTKPKGEVSAVEDIYETVTRGAADAIMYPMRKASGVKTFVTSKQWQKEKKERTPEKKSGFNPNQAG